MLFNSVVFLVFASLFFAAWPWARRRSNRRWAYLVGASFLFYGWWDWRFLFLIIASGLLDFAAGLGMEAFPRRRRLFLAMSIAGNVGSLAAFKYSAFLADNATAILRLLGIEADLRATLPEFMTLLPVGISFYTFQSMSYTIDIYRRELRPTRNLLHFFAYLSMFPQLVAGPIIRARDLLPQLEKSSGADPEAQSEGLRLIVHGFFKKMVIADGLAWYVTSAFSNPPWSNSSLYWWLITTAFAFQIYCDFSGYSDIARGLARWMGYDFVVNFNHPYGAASLREFWTRWHISLSTWFRDYVYIPLGGSRLGAWRSEWNMWVTMLVSGLWHGAAWTFVLWGACHALYLSIERRLAWPKHLSRIPGGRIIATVAMLVQVWVAWVFFRAESLSQATHILRTMLSLQGVSLATLKSELDGIHLTNIAVLLAIAAGREAYLYFDLQKRWQPPAALAPYVVTLKLAAMIAACVHFRGAGSEFIYFQF